MRRKWLTTKTSILSIAVPVYWPLNNRNGVMLSKLKVDPDDYAREFPDTVLPSEGGLLRQVLEYLPSKFGNRRQDMTVKAVRLITGAINETVSKRTIEEAYKRLGWSKSK
jgi:hypothetical protein